MKLVPSLYFRTFKVLSEEAKIILMLPNVINSIYCKKDTSDFRRQTTAGV
jgi:hypothetical protein